MGEGEDALHEQVRRACVFEDEKDKENSVHAYCCGNSLGGSPHG
jgi:hypothetical protein